MTRLSFVVMAAIALPAFAAENIALSAAYTVEPAPNYEHCLDAGDATQLADGQYVLGYFWTQPGTVGWAGRGIVVITLDLGADKPVAGLSFSTAADRARVEILEALDALLRGA